LGSGVTVLLRLLLWLALVVGVIAAGASSPALVSSAWAQYDRPTITGIRVEGTQRIEPETVESYLTIKTGDSFDPIEVDRSLKALFATGLFADVSMVRESTILVVKVVENPIINRLAFEGNKRIETSKLTDEVQLKARSVYTRTKVQSDVKRILEVYRRSGRFGATVDPKIIKLDQNRVDLVFEIVEGPITGISRISFIGNHRYTEGQLREQLQTKESRWYRFLSSEDNYDPDRVTYDRELLRRFYLKNGYADFRVLSTAAELSPDRESFYLTFTIEEGERYKFGKIQVASGIKEIKPAQLREKVKLNEGDWFNAEDLDNTTKVLTDVVGNSGYAFVEIEPESVRDREHHTMAVTINVREGPKVFVERIDITGNVRTLDSVIRREFRLVEGDAFNTSKLRRSERRLKDLNFFKKVEVTNVPGSQPDRTIIQAKVEEQSTGELSIGAGYSTTDGVLGQLGISEHNLLGRGQDLRLSATLAQRRQQYDLAFTEPYFLNRDVAATGDIFHTVSNVLDNYSFDEESTGVAFALGYNFSEHLRHTVRYTAREDSITNVASTASPYILAQKGRKLGSIVGEDFFYDQLDSRLEPSEGYYLSQGNDLAGLGGDLHYLRTRAKGAYYYPFAPKWIGVIKAEIGHIIGFNTSTEPIRINDRFYLGGDNLRGFKIGGAGPFDTCSSDPLGGNFYYSTTAELQIPLGLPEELGVSGRVFTDAGSSYGVDKPVTLYSQGACTGALSEVRDSNSLRASAGVGVSWKSPFGPIRVDLAKPYLKDRYDKTEFFRFSFGTKF
jgi:outer membrane protein insertion porin family